MKRKQIYFALAVLMLASLACNALSGGGGGGDSPVAPSGGDSPTTAAPQDNSGGGNADSSASGFPITPDAYNVVDVGDGNVLYYSKMPQADILKFYRDEYVSRGYTERALLTTVSDGVFSIVFDGDPSSKAVVIQSVDLGDGSCTVAISLTDV
ncbi:MAG TPA: hypothetical protein PKK96_06765 [Anaerolineales bacterium]|nr:hypothetical protein [Anaerolineales bacterium]HNQ93302.1 hypothetical protein [Anaerolineales bacterium]HNS60690.1 hypothetical protein [Anaerolineales bacterium]